MEPDPKASSSPTADPALPRDGSALLRLRERVEAAASEIERLRSENVRLAERLARTDGASGPALPMGDQDPAALRASIQSFIDAVDRVLAAEPASGA